MVDGNYDLIMFWFSFFEQGSLFMIDYLQFDRDGLVIIGALSSHADNQASVAILSGLLKSAD